MDRRLEGVKNILKKYGQEQLLDNYEKLDDRKKEKLLDEIEKIEVGS